MGLCSSVSSVNNRVLKLPQFYNKIKSLDFWLYVHDNIQTISIQHLFFFLMILSVVMNSRASGENKHTPTRKSCSVTETYKLQKY